MSTCTHICLLAERPAPNVCPLLDPTLQADEAVFVVGPQRLDRLDWLRRILDGQDRQMQVSSLPIDDAHGDVQAIQAVIEGEIKRQRERGAGVLVNVTGGTRPMVIGAHMAAVNTDTPVFYVHDDTVAWLHLPTGDKRATVDLAERLKLPAFLLAYGIKVIDSGAPALPPGAEHITGTLLKDPGKHVRGIRALNYHASKAEHRLHTGMDKGDREFQPLQDILAMFEQQGLLHTGHDEIRFDNEAARFFCAGGWLEHATSRCIRDMAPTLGKRLNDCLTSVEVEYLQAGKHSPKNEIDVAVLYNNGLHLIECKTRHFAGRDSAELTDALYKLATLRHELGGIHARAMVVSYLDVEPWHRERAELLDIELVAGNQLRSLGATIQTWLQGP